MKKIIILWVVMFLLISLTALAQTTINLSSSEIIDDQRSSFGNPDTNFETQDGMDMCDVASCENHQFFRINITKIPVGVELINVTLFAPLKDFEVATMISSIFEVFSNRTSYDTSTMTWNTDEPCGGTIGNTLDADKCNTTSEDNQTIVGVATYQFDIIRMMKKRILEGDKNLTMVTTVPLIGSGQTHHWVTEETPNQDWYVLVTFIVTDINPPTFNRSSINISNPKFNDVVGLSQEILDDQGLVSYRLADNRTGTFINSSEFLISGTLVNATFNFTPNVIRGSIVGFLWTAVDVAGKSNQTAIETFTVANTPPEDPIILFPTEDLLTLLQPLDFNVTFLADIDGDSLIINYYIDGILNQSSNFNVTFNASDKTYILNVSLFDGFDSSFNVTVEFTIDTTNPLITIISPLNNSIHSTDIPINLICDNIHVINLSYNFHNSSDILQTNHNDTDLSPFITTQAIIIDSINISLISDGNYFLNISCTDNISNTAFKQLNLEIDTTIPAPLITAAVTLANYPVNNFLNFIIITLVIIFIAVLIIRGLKGK